MTKFKKLCSLSKSPYLIRRPGLVKDVIVAAAEELQHVLVVQGVVDRSPGSPCPDEPQHPQQAQVVGDGRLCNPKELGEVVHA